MLLQSCPTLCDPIDGSPPGSTIAGILQARILEWAAISFSNACMHAKSLRSCLTLCDPMEPARLLCPQDSPGKNTGVGAVSFSTSSGPSEKRSRYHEALGHCYRAWLPGGSNSKESTCNAGDLGWIPELGRSPGGGHGNPLQYSFPENPMGRGAWRATVHGVAKRHD